MAVSAVAGVADAAIRVNLFLSDRWENWREHIASGSWLIFLKWGLRKDAAEAEGEGGSEAGFKWKNVWAVVAQQDSIFVTAATFFELRLKI